jgi:RNA polymerase sigma-70 factor (ECF subfamily)
MIPAAGTSRNELETDLQTAKRVLAGDEAAFEQLFELYFPRLYRFALVRLNGNRDDACDAVQLTFCRGFERLDSFRGEASLYAWLCQVCRNAIADIGRERKRALAPRCAFDEDEGIAAILESLAAPAVDEPETRAWRTELAQLIQATLDCLPERYGDVLEWKYVDGLPVKEIARRLDLGPKAAESLVMRARQAFREAIADLSGSADLLGVKNL